MYGPRRAHECARFRARVVEAEDEPVQSHMPIYTLYTLSYTLSQPYDRTAEVTKPEGLRTFFCVRRVSGGTLLCASFRKRKSQPLISQVFNVLNPKPENPQPGGLKS